ncbi:MAG TPA: hypothetical protein VHH55_01315 [Gaiellaceae bacterium]|jgi:hypothetical protein|nr:hypothetical protein [Gaiellaceae bacterium]
MRYWRRRHEDFDLEAELRAGRPEPASDFTRKLEMRVRNHGRSRAGSLRVAFVGALTAMLLLGLASVGGVSYASSAAKDAAVSVKRVAQPGDVITILKRSPSIDQYKKPKAKKVKKVKKAKKGKAAKGRVRARTRPPFTG